MQTPTSLQRIGMGIITLKQMIYVKWKRPLIVHVYVCMYPYM